MTEPTGDYEVDVDLILEELAESVMAWASLGDVEQVKQRLRWALGDAWREGKWTGVAVDVENAALLKNPWRRDRGRPASSSTPAE